MLYRGDDVSRLNRLAALAERHEVSSGRHQRRPLSHAQAPAAAGCADRDPHARPRGAGGLAPRRQCRAPPQERGRDGAALPEPRGCRGPHPGDRGTLRLQPRRAGLRVSRRAGARRQHAAAAPGGVDLGRSRSSAIPAAPRPRSAARWCTSSGSSPSSATRPTSSPCTTSCASPGGRASSARGGARPPTPPSAIASASPPSTRRRSTCCSSASSRASGASPPTSTSTSSTSGARR